MDETFEQKTQRNFRAKARYDDLMREGKHGHYETMNRVIREEVERERERCAKIADEHAKSECAGQESPTEAMRLGARSIAGLIRDPA